MKWVVQSNVYAEEGYDSLLQAIRDRGHGLTTVKVVPFSAEIVSMEGALPMEGEPAIALGTYSLVRAGMALGWRPGAFLENLDFEVQRGHWGERMLNHRASVHRFDSIPFQERPFFLRPVHDSKAFAGFVCDWGYYSEWADSIGRLEFDRRTVPLPMGLGTLVMVCPVVDIDSETRTWVIGGQVITASGYKRGTIKRYTRPSDVPHHITDFSQRCADIWCPNGAFVLDVADTPDGLRIVEVNNFNSAGFYLGDMGEVIGRLGELHG